MHRILLVTIICLSLFETLHCGNQNFLRQIELPKKDYRYTKRLPFIANACNTDFLFQKGAIPSIDLVSIWEDGKFRNLFLNKEPFDAIEDLNVYQSHDYFWELRLIPHFARHNCSKYHITGYLLYFDQTTKQKLTSNLEKNRKVIPPDLPIMITREYQLVDLETIYKNLKSGTETPFFHTKYTTAPNPRDPFSERKVWDPKPKSEITILSNERLIDYCLEFPFECVTDPNYLGEIQFRNRKNQKHNADLPEFSKNLQTEIQKIKDVTYFGCYCRKDPNLSIYQTCPIDQFGLDSICKRKNDCLTTANDEKNKLCKKQFKEELSVLIKTKESKDQIHQDKDNFDRMILYTKKFWAIEVLEELGE